MHQAARVTAEPAFDVDTATRAAAIVAPRVLTDVQRLGAVYRSAAPFPHIVIDDFLRPDVASFVAANFPSMNEMPTVFKEPMSYKGQLSDIDGKWPRFTDVFQALQSPDLRRFLTALTGIDDLVEDPILAGGGLHQSPRSGFLDIHVDANFHPNDKTLHRRMNLLIYVTPDWQAAWGGALQLWTDRGNKPGEVVHSVEPRFNRAVVFNTTRTSWHGVTQVNCPEGFSRRSLALYYYTHERPASERYRDSSVIWMNRTVPWKRAMYPVMNFGIALLKPYARQIRAALGRDRVFDAAPKSDKRS